MVKTLSVLPIALALFVAPVVRAQDVTAKAPDPAKRGVTEEMFGLLHPETTIKQMFDQVKQTVTSEADKTCAEQLSPSPDKAKYDAAMRDFHERLFAAIEKQLDWQKMKPQMLAIYEETFTLPELEGMLAFYKSPAGQATITKLPMVMHKTMAMAEENMQDLMPTVQRITSDFVAQMKQAEAAQQPK